MTVIKSRMATFVVLVTDVTFQVASVAREHVALDSARRRLLLPNDTGYPSAAQITAWQLDTNAAAVLVTPDGRLADVLDRKQATSSAWIEDAFVRALRNDAGHF